MRVKCNTSCLWGVHHAWGPNFQIEDGMVLDSKKVPENTNLADWTAFMGKLLDAGHAVHVADEPVEDAKEPDVDADNSDEAENAEGDADEDNSEDANEVTAESLKAELEGIAKDKQSGIMGSEQKAKAALETLGKERYNFDVDKRMSVDNIIQAIVEAAFKE